MVAGQVTSAIHKLMLTELSHSLVENRISAIRKWVEIQSICDE